MKHPVLGVNSRNLKNGSIGSLTEIRPVANTRGLHRKKFEGYGKELFCPLKEEVHCSSRGLFKAFHSPILNGRRDKKQSVSLLFNLG